MRLLALGLMLALQASPVSMRLLPEGSELWIELRIPPDEANRAVVLTLENPGDYFSLSRFDLDEDSPPVLTLQRRNLPSGDYDVEAQLFKAHEAGDEYIAGTVRSQVTIHR